MKYSSPKMHGFHFEVFVKLEGIERERCFTQERIIQHYNYLEL